MGKRERDRLKMLQEAPEPLDPPRPRKEMDEIANERGIELLPERGETPGSRLPIHLHSSTRAPTLQHVAERMNLICAQNNLPAPSRSVPALMTLACDVCGPLHSFAVLTIYAGQAKTADNACSHINVLFLCNLLYFSFFVICNCPWIPPSAKQAACSHTGLVPHAVHRVTCGSPQPLGSGDALRGGPTVPRK